MEKVRVIEVQELDEEYKNAELIISADDTASDEYKTGFLEALYFTRKLINEKFQNHYVFDLENADVKNRYIL